MLVGGFGQEVVDEVGCLQLRLHIVRVESKYLLSSFSDEQSLDATAACLCLKLWTQNPRQAYFHHSNHRHTNSPFNPYRYPECRGVVFRPSYADDGSYQNLLPDSPFLSEPPNKLRLERARGYHGGGFYPPTDNNAFFLGEDNMPELDGPGQGGQKEKTTGANQKEKKNTGSGNPGGNHKRTKTGIGSPAVASKKTGFNAKEVGRDGGGGGGGGVGKKAGLVGEEAFRSGSGVGVTGHDFFEVVYPTAALVVMHKFPTGAREVPEEDEEEEQEALREEGEQVVAKRGRAKRAGAKAPVKRERFFDGHSDDVTAIAVHPAGVIVASGQVRGFLKPSCRYVR